MLPDFRTICFLGWFHGLLCVVSDSVHYRYQSDRYTCNLHKAYFWIRLRSSHVVIHSNEASDVTDHVITVRRISASLLDVWFFDTSFKASTQKTERHITRLWFRHECLLSYSEGTAHVHCYTSCTLKSLYCSIKCH